MLAGRWFVLSNGSLPSLALVRISPVTCYSTRHAVLLLVLPAVAGSRYSVRAGAEELLVPTINQRPERWLALDIEISSAQGPRSGTRQSSIIRQMTLKSLQLLLSDQSCWNYEISVLISSCRWMLFLKQVLGTELKTKSFDQVDSISCWKLWIWALTVKGNFADRDFTSSWLLTQLCVLDTLPMIWLLI